MASRITTGSSGAPMASWGSCAGVGRSALPGEDRKTAPRWDGKPVWDEKLDVSALIRQSAGDLGTVEFGVGRMRGGKATGG